MSSLTYLLISTSLLLPLLSRGLYSLLIIAYVFSVLGMFTWQLVRVASSIVTITLAKANYLGYLSSHYAIPLDDTSWLTTKDLSIHTGPKSYVSISTMFTYTDTLYTRDA